MTAPRVGLNEVKRSARDCMHRKSDLLLWNVELLKIYLKMEGRPCRLTFFWGEGSDPKLLKRDYKTLNILAHRTFTPSSKHINACTHTHTLNTPLKACECSLMRSGLHACMTHLVQWANYAWCAGVCAADCISVSMDVNGPQPQASGPCKCASRGEVSLCSGACVSACRWNIISLNICIFMFNYVGLVESGNSLFFQKCPAAHSDNVKQIHSGELRE